MPRRPGLKVVPRKGSASLYIRGTVAGQRVDESAGTTDPHLAEKKRAARENELYHAAIYGRRPVGTFAHAVSAYLDTKDRPVRTADFVGRLLKHFGTTPLDKIDQSAVDRACKVLLRPGASEATKLRSIITPLRAVMMHAHVRGNGPRLALEKIRLPKARTKWLTPAQARALLTAAAPHLKPLLLFLLGCGARMSEALDLEWNDVDLPHGRATLDTKTDVLRIAALPPAAVAALGNLPTGEDGTRTGKVFLRPTHSGHMAAYADRERLEGGQIRRGWNGACRRAGIAGFTPHDLRHTWASWWLAVNAGNIVALRDEGCWATVAMVERYAHLVPAGLVAEIEAFWGLNPRKTPTGQIEDRASA